MPRTKSRPSPAVAQPVAAVADVSVMAVTEFVHGTTRRQVGDWFAVPSDRVEPLETAGLVLSQDSARTLWEARDGRILTPAGVDAPKAAQPAAGALRVLQLCGYDPGSAAYRYHSAFNTSPALVSAFARYGDGNPHSSLRQYDVQADRVALDGAWLTAQVVHCHVDYRIMEHHMARWPMDHQLVVRHYHGSISNNGPRILVDHEADARFGAVQVGARLYHRRFGGDVHWLPIPMPVAQYARMATPAVGDTLRIAHAPTVRAIKGTDVLEQVVRDLRDAGRDVELVLIENLSHGDALRLKATCHVTFDSFWLGLQGSGLEGAAMGQMVVAGDTGARDEYVREVGACPYTFASDRDELYAVLDRACTDADWRASEAARVGTYVRKYHDYAAVAARYIGIIRAAWASRGLPLPEVPA